MDVREKYFTIDKLCDEMIIRANHLHDYYDKKVADRKRKNLKFEFVIKDSEKINGKSGCEADFDYIELNRGVIELYYNYFENVLNDRLLSQLKYFGIDKSEDEMLKMSYEGIVWKNKEAHIYDSKVLDYKKIYLLDTFVARFIVLHELGHIYNGHCTYLAQNKEEYQADYMPLYMNAMQEKRKTEEECLDIRTLEMDADAFAATQSLLYLFYLYENYEREVDSSIARNDLFYLWSFAIRSHFLMTEDLFADQMYYKKMTHFPSCARWAMIMTICFELIQKYVMQDIREEFLVALAKGVKQAELTFNKIKYTNYNWEREITDNQDYINYKDEVDENWKKLKEKVSRYARFPLA